METPAGRSFERVVLVVEDEPTVRQYVVRALADVGFRVLVASNGGEALAVLSTLGATVVWLVISDIRMPAMDGLELAAVVTERWPTVPVLLVSGRPPLAWEGPFLHKPFTPGQLIDAVEGLLPPASQPHPA